MYGIVALQKVQPGKAEEYIELFKHLQAHGHSEGFLEIVTHMRAMLAEPTVAEIVRACS